VQSICPSVTWTFCHVIWECARQNPYVSVLGPTTLSHYVSKDTELLLSTRYCDCQYNTLERCPLFWFWLPLQKVNEYPSWERVYSLCSMGMKFAWIPSTFVFMWIYDCTYKTLHLFLNLQVKTANRLIMSTKCHAIRDAQIVEKKQIMKELEDEECRLDQVMEDERRHALHVRNKKKQSNFSSCQNVFKLCWWHPFFF